MKKIKATLSALALSMTLCAPVIAQPHTPVISNTLSAHDLEMAFENAGEPMDLALLSEQEMAETKGAVVPLLIARVTYGGISGGYVYFMSYFFSPDFSYSGFARAVGLGAFGGLFGVTTGGQVILGAGASSVLGRILDHAPIGG